MDWSKSSSWPADDSRAERGVERASARFKATERSDLNAELL